MTLPTPSDNASVTDGKWEAIPVVWQTIESAPRDGTPIQARIPGNGSDNIIAWLPGYLDMSGNECSCWVMVEDQEPPDCWHDGVCWESNADEVASVKPTHWCFPSHPHPLNPVTEAEEI